MWGIPRVLRKTKRPVESVIDKNKEFFRRGCEKLEKTRENQTYIEFKKIPIGNLDGKQVDLKQFEISKSREKEYRTIRNSIIVELYKRNLRYAEISNLQVQDIDNSFALIRIQRGDRVFRMAISPQITAGLKALTKYKDNKDYIFTKDLINEKPLSGTMIAKIIKKYNEIDIKQSEIKIKEVHSIEKVCGKYLIYKNGRAIEGLVVNSMVNALRIRDILNADELIK